MNKNRFFMISMIIVSALLCVLRMTGLTANIAVSVVGLAIMIPISSTTRKDLCHFAAPPHPSRVIGMDGYRFRRKQKN